MTGALRLAAGDDGEGLERAWDVVSRVICWFSVARWNDLPSRTHAEVLAAFDKAIVAAQKMGRDAND